MILTKAKKLQLKQTLILVKKAIRLAERGIKVVSPKNGEEKAFIETAIADTHGRLTEAADRLGLSRRSLYRRIKQHDLRDQVVLARM